MSRKLFKYLIAIPLALLFAITAYAAAPVEQDSTSSIASGATTISLPGLYSHIIVKLSAGSSSMYVTFNHGSTASSSDFLIDSGGTLSFGLQGFSGATDQINYFGNGTTGTISWMAW